MIPESPIANEIAADLAQANDKLQVVLVYCVMLVVVIAILCWLAYRHDMRLLEEKRRVAEDDAADADLELTVELSKPSWQRDYTWWSAWCDRQELLESTRRTLLAGIGDDEREVAA